MSETYFKTRYTVVCQHCSQPFTGCRKTQRYCSRGCTEKARMRRIRTALPEDNITKTCGMCGKTFKVNGVNHRQRAVRYCSAECRKKAYTAAHKRSAERMRQGISPKPGTGRPRTLTDAERLLRKRQGKCQRWFRKHGITYRCVAHESGQQCQENRVLDLAHKIPRHGRWSGVPTREEVWPLCPTHHRLLDQGLMTSDELGLKDAPPSRLEWEGVNVMSWRAQP